MFPGYFPLGNWTKLKRHPLLQIKPAEKYDCISRNKKPKIWVSNVQGIKGF